MTITRSTPKIITAACIASAFAAGFIAAMWSEGFQTNTPAQQSKTSSNYRTLQHNNAQTIEGEIWKAEKVKLIKRWEASPSAYSDFPLHEATHAILEKVPTSELEIWFLEINAYLSHNDEWGVNPDLQEMIFLVLAKRNPERLMQFLEANSEEESNFSIEDVLSIWIKQEPLSALKWLENGNIPEKLREDFDNFIEDTLVKLSVKDPIEFENRLARVDSELRESILQDHAYLVGIASGRAAILDRAASSEHAEAMALWKGLLRRESEINPEKSYATLNQLAISEADRTALDLDLVKWILSYKSTIPDHRAEFIRTWLERNPQRSAPSVMVETYIEWFENDSQKASDWISKRLPDAHYDRFATQLIEQRIHDNQADYPLFAQLADQITDSTARTASLRLVKDTWHSKNPTAASEWQGSLTAEDREALK